jgi:hypothetical protein
LFIVTAVKTPNLTLMRIFKRLKAWRWHIYVDTCCPPCRNLREDIGYTCMTGKLFYIFLLFSTKCCKHIEINKYSRSEVKIKYGPQMKYRIEYIPQTKLGHGMP